VFIAPPGYRWVLPLTAFITRQQHARMPLLILRVGITKPLFTCRAAHGRRVGAGRIARRDALAQPLQVRALTFLFFHPHDAPRVAILLVLVCSPESESPFPVSAFYQALTGFSKQRDLRP